MAKVVTKNYSAQAVGAYKTKVFECECYDRGCPVHGGVEKCNVVGEMKLYVRPDWGDAPDYAYFCDGCGEDACNAGTWTPDEDER